MAPSDIIIVDDNPANLKLLEDMLRQQGHEVRAFPLGRLALMAATKHPPDLILLDINMPEMNGYEVCQRLKSAETLAEIPVIFLSALNDLQDKVEAFRTGAVDYISKPFQFEEVHARVETHLKLHHFQQALKMQNERLEEAVAARTRELAEANGRLTILDRSKNEFLNLISHELRTPLHGILGVSEVMLNDMPFTKENDELRDLFERSRHRILSTVDDALLLTQIDVNGLQLRSVPVSLRAALGRAMDQTREFAKSRCVVLDAPPIGPETVVAHEELLVRALHSLLETAVRFSAAGERVRFTREGDALSPTIVIECHGKTIPDSTLVKFFDLFSVGEESTTGTDLGLGPAVAYRILSLFGALVTLTNQKDPAGIRFAISLKNAAPLVATAR